MRRFVFFALLAPIGALAQTDALQDYLKERSKVGVRESVGVPTLETLVGTRVAEIRVAVKGSIRMGDSGTVMVETEGGRPIPIQASPVPDWLMGGNVRARLLIRAERTHESAPLRASLIAAVPEETMADWERRNRAAPASSAGPRRVASASASRSRAGSGQRPAPMPGEIRPAQPRSWNVPASDAVPYYRDFILRQNRRLSNAEATRIAEGVIGFSLKYGVDARLVMAMIMVESGFNPNATSHRGAMGLGQLMPGTARGLGVTNAYDSVENLYGMVRLVRGHIDKYHRQTGGDEYETLVLMLAAYNAGPGAVRRHGGVPPFRETQNYVRKVTALYRQLSGG